MVALIADISLFALLLGSLWLAAYVFVNKVLPRHDF
jgi:hypothetical protein